MILRVKMHAKVSAMIIFVLLLQVNPMFSQIKLVVLGTLQDAGSPHIACAKLCCKDLFENPDPNRKVVSLGLIDEENYT